MAALVSWQWWMRLARHAAQGGLCKSKVPQILHVLGGLGAESAWQGAVLALNNYSFQNLLFS